MSMQTMWWKVGHLFSEEAWERFCMMSAVEQALILKHIDEHGVNPMVVKGGDN